MRKGYAHSYRSVAFNPQLRRSSLMKICYIEDRRIFIQYIFDNKDTPGDNGKPTFQFGGINGFLAPTTLSIFSSPVSQSFSMPTPTLFSMNHQSIFTGLAYETKQ